METSTSSSACFCWPCSQRPHRVYPLALRYLQWLSVPERIDVTLTFQCCLRGLAPTFLTEDIKDVYSDPGRRRLRSMATGHHVILRVRHRTIGGRAFGASAARHVTCVDSELHFKII